jgi:predicted ATPase
VNDIAPGIANLVEKSLVVAEISNIDLQYRLFDSTRAYALEKLTQSAEREQIARRHAEYYCQLFERAELEWETRPTTEWLAAYRAEVDNVRTALDWAFASNGDAALGVRLTVAMVPLWMQLSLIKECCIGVERAVTVPDETDQSTRRQMKLFTALGWALVYTNVPASGAAWGTALKLAETLDDTEYRLRVLRGMWVVDATIGDFNNSLALAKRFHRVAASTTNPSDLAVADRMMGWALHSRGDQTSAEKYTRRALQHYVTPTYRSDIVRFQFDQQVSARSLLARILWVKGLHDQAQREITRNVEYAISINHTVSLCNALAQTACPIALQNGDVARADHYTSMLLQHAEQNAPQYLRAYGDYYQGRILINRGVFDAGLRLSRSAVNTLRAAQSAQRLTALLTGVALSACQAGEVEEGFTLIEEALQRCERYGDRWCMAEVLRVKGELICRAGAPDRIAQAEECFAQSLDCARRQGAVSWELKTAMSLARLRCDQGQVDQARDLLTSAYMLFSEGFDTADLKATKELLKSMD